MRSLRWRIAALVALACCAVAVVIGVLVHGATLERSLQVGRERAYNALTEVRREGTGQDKPTEEIPPPLLSQMLVSDEPVYWFDDRKSESPWMWGGQRVGDQMLTVQVDMGVHMRALVAFDRDVAQAALAALAVIVPLSLLLAELPNRRLRRVAGTARRIAEGDLDARIAGPVRRGDEIAEISTAVDSMADSLQSRLQNEQRFTADVAHELRTPLMGLVTSAELLPEGEATDLVRDRVRVLRALVEDLLEISRLDAGAEHADLRPVALADVVAASLERTALPVRPAVTAPGTAETDPRRLDRILANLVINAHRHGGAPVEVTVDGTTIVVRDHGPGFPADLLADGPQRFRTGAAERGRGHGLGLTIATGQARVIGAVLILANAPDGGAVATLRLPPPPAG
ncbi:ATP-binding protein [Nonomuraea sp. NPDC059007]|uniref:ATP-binding protein n=1 Tax=Nonomuraea sp. NPDC059007 TaxID=3346692 RepID=UPI003678DA7A